MSGSNHGGRVVAAGPGWAFSLLAAAALLVLAGPRAEQVEAQAVSDRDGYVRLVAGHFDLPVAEAERLLEGRIAPDELPVLLFLERQSGIAAPALLAIRRSGSGWSALGRRYGIGGDRFHVEIPEGSVDARTRGAFERFQSTPRSGWAALDFSDEEIVTLVNLRVLSARFTVPVARVIEARGSVGSWVEVPGRLAGRASW
jgi:hypothetical protein